MEEWPLAVKLVLGVVAWTVAFVVLWRIVLLILAKVARWPELKRRYAVAAPYAGPVWRSASGHLGPVWYASALTLGSSATGLYMAPQFPFHFETAPVLIPWSDIDIETKDRLIYQSIHLKFRTIPGLELRVSGKGAAWILQAKDYPEKRHPRERACGILEPDAGTV